MFQSDSNTRLNLRESATRVRTRRGRRYLDRRAHDASAKYAVALASTASGVTMAVPLLRPPRAAADTTVKSRPGLRASATVETGTVANRWVVDAQKRSTPEQ